MSSLRDRSNRIRPRSRGKETTFLSIIALLFMPLANPPAQATDPQPTLGMYLDQPFVQGSYVAEDYPSNTTVTTFNDQDLGSTCSVNGSAHLEPLFGESINCFVISEQNYGGASTESSTPVVGQTPSVGKYAQVGANGVSIVFDSPQTYFGLWWTAGNGGNSIQIKNGAEILAGTTADDISSSLYGSGTLTAESGANYATKFYIGNPLDWYSIGSPTDFSDQDSSNTYDSYRTLAQEPFVYIHFVAAAGVTFDRVNLFGTGFEFDNLTSSSETNIATDGVPTELVLKRQLYAPNYVDFDANGGNGNLPRQYSVDSSAAYLQSNCLDWSDPNRCISAPNNSYSTYQSSWNTAPDGSGDSYDLGAVFPFTSSTTLYAQWTTQFNFYNVTNPDVNANNVWDYVDWDTYSYIVLNNFGDLTLPSPTRTDQYLEGWYMFDPATNFNSLLRIGGPGDVISSSSYTTWDSNMFARWLPNPPPVTVDATVPDVLLLYPGSTSVLLPALPLTGDTSAQICLAESDSSGNSITSNFAFTDQLSSSSGFSSSFEISDTAALLGETSKYIRVLIAQASDSTCSNPTTHIIELRPLGVDLTKILPLYLTER